MTGRHSPASRSPPTTAQPPGPTRCPRRTPKAPGRPRPGRLAPNCRAARPGTQLAPDLPHPGCRRHPDRHPAAAAAGSPSRCSASPGAKRHSPPRAQARQAASCNGFAGVLHTDATPRLAPLDAGDKRPYCDRIEADLTSIKERLHRPHRRLDLPDASGKKPYLSRIEAPDRGALAAGRV